LRIVGRVIIEHLAPARTQQVEFVFEPVSPVGARVAASADRFGVDQLCVRCKDNAFAGFAQAQAIVDVVKRHGEAAFVHPADRKIVASPGCKAGSSQRAAFVRHEELIEKAGVIADSVCACVRD
jgi:hypothetical protein